MCRRRRRNWRRPSSWLLTAQASTTSLASFIEGRGWPIARRKNSSLRPSLAVRTRLERHRIHSRSTFRASLKSPGSLRADGPQNRMGGEAHSKMKAEGIFVGLSTIDNIYTVLEHPAPNKKITAQSLQ